MINNTSITIDDKQSPGISVAGNIYRMLIWGEQTNTTAFIACCTNRRGNG
jgi:hypothetical protein